MTDELKKAIEIIKMHCVSDEWLQSHATDEDVNGCDEKREYNDAVRIIRNAIAVTAEQEKASEALERLFKTFNMGDYYSRYPQICYDVSAIDDYIRSPHAVAVLENALTPSAITDTTIASAIAECECQRAYLKAHNAPTTGGIDLIESVIRSLTQDKTLEIVKKKLAEKGERFGWTLDSYVAVESVLNAIISESEATK